MSQLIATMQTVQWYCDDIHTGANKNVSFGFADLSAAPAGWGLFGQVAVSQHQGFDNFFQIVIREIGTPDPTPKIKAPDFMMKVWEKSGDGGECVVTYGCNDPSGNPDPNYVAIGDLYVRDYAANVKPSNFPTLVCVRKDQLIPALYDKQEVWDDSGSEAQDNVSLWGVRDNALVWSGDTQPDGFIFKAISAYFGNRSDAVKTQAAYTLNPAVVAFRVTFDAYGQPVQPLPDYGPN